MTSPSGPVKIQTSTSVSQNQPQTAEGPALPIDWNGWLAEVRALPPEASEWESIPQFLETLQQLYDKNQQEREERNTQRQRLQAALSDLTQAEGILTFFEMQDVSSWTVEACLPTHVPTVTQLSERFLALLLEYDKHSQWRAATRADDLVRRQKVDELDTGITEIHKRLADLFTSSPKQPSQQQKVEKHQADTELRGTFSQSFSETLNEPSLVEQSEEVVPQEGPASLPEIESMDSREDKPDPPLAASASPEPTPSEPTPPIPEPQPELPTVHAGQELGASKEEPPKLGQGEQYEDDAESESAFPKTGESHLTELPSNAPPLADPSPERIDQKEASSIPVFVKPEVSPSDILLPGASNPDIQKSAFHLQTTCGPADWTSLLWALIAEDALPTAYWLARAWPAMNQPCPIPYGLLAAIQAVRWLVPNSQAFVDDLTGIIQITPNKQLFEDEPQKLLGLAAALRATLLAPSTGIQAWLNVSQRCPSLDNIVKAINTFAYRGRPLRLDDLLGATAVKDREESRRQAVRRAKAWLEEASKRRTTLKRASDVWRRMMAPDGALRTLLLPVAEDDQRNLAEVHKNLQQWKDKNSIISRINEIDQELAGKKHRRIEGKIRNRIVQDVQEAYGLIRFWCECVEREQAIQSGEDSFFEKTNEVRLQIQEALPEAIPALQKLSRSGQLQPIGAAAQCLLRSLEQLRDMFTDQSSQPLTHRQDQQNWFTANTDSLSTALDRLLLWLPEIPQKDGEETFDKANLPQVAPALCHAIAEGRSLQTAFDTWLAKQDYRFVETMLSAFDEAYSSAKSPAYQEALEGSRKGLHQAVEDTRTAIERAVVDGINAEERSEHEGIIESMNPDETLYFPPEDDHLNQVKTKLEEARRVRLEEVRAEWDRIQPQLDKRTNARIAPTKLEAIRAFVRSNLDRQETRVVEECVAHLTEVVEEGRELEEELFSPPGSRDALQEFIEATPQLEDALQRTGMNLRQVAKNIERGSSIAGIRFDETPKKRRDEAVQAVGAWRSLKQEGVNGRSVSKSITILLRYLGFDLKSESDLSVPNVKQGAEWVHIQAQMSASDLAKPIPQFGSQIHGRYDIVCVWERPGADTLSAWLRDLRLDTHAVLVFYLGRLTVRQRRDYTRRARNEELIIAVLDETLLVFLAQERDARLPIFLRCTLPFSAVNPYTPFRAGDVPPEMFFGRDQMARDIQRSSGSCLVYGGRQLGKSALLQHVQREFHHPEREQYAWVEDIKSLGDPQPPDPQPPESLWGQVRDSLKELKLLPRQITTNKPEEVMRHIREVMAKRPERRVLMLFDEADNFLDADAKDRFQVVEGLRTLMLDTQRRFKVVFAGLHNVQRFQGIPNQPLAHFGAPLLVGPLEPTAAQQLVREPLEVLGYQFDDNAGTILRILSYTNYHPGLIQLFCHELLKRLQQQSTSPPYSIAQNDVEAVYLLPQVRDGIRERFDWTLALDPRYQAIVWVMIFDQIGTRDGYAQAYAPADLLKLSRDWWPKGFDKVDSDQLKGLLDEMRGLGILVRDASGYYRLRSPNLVRLVGTETDIEERLLALSDKEPEEPFDADSHHTMIDAQGGQYSPLTYAQERRLNVAQFGVGLVFASDATGLAHLKAAFRHFIPADLPETKGDYQEIPSTVLSTTGLQGWLKHYLGEHRNYERLILYCSLQGMQVNLLETVRIAHKVCQQHERSKKRSMRILFVFDPESTWNWLSLSQQQRQEIENQVDVVTFPRRWNLSGIDQRLRQQDKWTSDPVCRAVLEGTGGWSSLLDELFNRCDLQDDPRSAVDAVDTIKRDLGDPGSQLSQDFKRSLGLSDVAERILKFVKTEGDREKGISVEYIDPEFINGLSQNECDAAVKYLQRLGCIELQGDQLSVERTVFRHLLAHERAAGK